MYIQWSLVVGGAPPKVLGSGFGTFGGPNGVEVGVYFLLLETIVEGLRNRHLRALDKIVSHYFTYFAFTVFGLEFGVRALLLPASTASKSQVSKKHMLPQDPCCKHIRNGPRVQAAHT